MTEPRIALIDEWTNVLKLQYAEAVTKNRRSRRMILHTPEDCVAGSIEVLGTLMRGITDTEKVIAEGRMRKIVMALRKRIVQGELPLRSWYWCCCC